MALYVPAVGVADWLSIELLARRGLAEVWLERGANAHDRNQECPPRSVNAIEEDAVEVMIGVDPHKGSHTAAVLDDTERFVCQLRVDADRWQRHRLLRFAEPFEPRT